jgi:tripeptide aminopeptidase
MVQVCEEAAAHYGAALEVELDHQYDAYRLSENDAVVSLALRAARGVGLPAATKEVGGGSDANVFNAMSLPACVLGTAMTRVHTHEERASIEDLVKSAEWVVAIIEEAAAVR